LIVKIAPGIAVILSNTDGPFAKLFERFTTVNSGTQKKEPIVNTGEKK
jgi:hypothetical protein